MVRRASASGRSSPTSARRSRASPARSPRTAACCRHVFAKPARMRIAHINGCNVCMAWRVPALAKRGVTEELYAHVDEPGHEEYSAAESLAIEYAARYADRPPFDRRRVLRALARGVERCRDPRAHHPDRRLARVRSPHRGARSRPGLRVGAPHRRLNRSDQSPESVTGEHRANGSARRGGDRALAARRPRHAPSHRMNWSPRLRGRGERELLTGHDRPSAVRRAPVDRAVTDDADAHRAGPAEARGDRRVGRERDHSTTTSAPVHPPSQPANAKPGSGWASRRTCEPASHGSSHTSGHTIPGTSLTTRPPGVATATASRTVGPSRCTRNGELRTSDAPPVP